MNVQLTSDPSFKRSCLNIHRNKYGYDPLIASVYVEIKLNINFQRPANGRQRELRELGPGLEDYRLLFFSCSINKRYLNRVFNIALLYEFTRFVRSD